MYLTSDSPEKIRAIIDLFFSTSWPELSARHLLPEDGADWQNMTVKWLNAPLYKGLAVQSVKLLFPKGSKSDKAEKFV